MKTLTLILSIMLVTFCNAVHSKSADSNNQQSQSYSLTNRLDLNNLVEVAHLVNQKTQCTIDAAIKIIRSNSNPNKQAFLLSSTQENCPNNVTIKIKENFVVPIGALGYVKEGTVLIYAFSPTAKYVKNSYGN